MTNIDTRNLDALAGAVYFTVGRGTEGGSASYRLSVAGVGRNEWGEPSAVAANSGYSIGTIQVDLGQRGTWPLGETSNRALRPGETTYVDGIIGQAADYARRNGLTFPQDTTQLRANLLSHGNGQGGRDTIHFIDPAVRDSINAWAGSDEGKRWIHSHIDYPQVRNATQTAMTILDRSGSNITEDRRFEAINILAKTANQYPRGLDRLENVLREGGDYNALLAETQAIRGSISYYDGPKAASVAQAYEDTYAADPNRRAAMDRAHAAVARDNYDPSTERSNPDVQQALGAIGSAPARRGSNAVLEEGESGREVRKLESNLAGLGYTDAQGQALVVDGRFTAETRQAVENYQRSAQLSGVDGRAGPQTLGSIDQTVRSVQQDLTTLDIRSANGQPVGVDGYYGNGTREAVRTFQQANGLDPTGIADDATRQAIGTAARERTQAQPTPADPAQAQPTPAQPAQGTHTFDETMRTMLPTQAGTDPHLTSHYGQRMLNGHPDNHGGVDFNYTGGQNGRNLEHPVVRSPVSGTVVYGEGQGQYGTVKIRDDQGNMHEILHMDSRSVRVTNPPTRVEAGDPIGTMGGRGPDGPSQYAQHVHYQIRDPQGQLTDPEAFWNGRQRTQGQAQPTPAQPDAHPQAAQPTPAQAAPQQPAQPAPAEPQRTPADPAHPQAAPAQTPSPAQPQPAHADPQRPPAEAARAQPDAHPAAPARSDAMADNVLRRGETAPEVGQYQRMLADMGYRGADGRPLAVDNKFGPNTEHATRAFQRDHGIEQTGTLGPRTRAAADKAGRELVSHPDNPSNRTFRQTLEKVYEAENTRGLPHGEHSRNLAGALIVEAARERLTQVDRVELSRDGSMARAVQFSAMGDRPEINRHTDGVSTQQVVQQPIRESSERTVQVAQNVAIQQAQERQQPQQQAPISQGAR